VYLVQDIETSYYPDEPITRARVIASYREEFRYCTTSSWNRDRLRDLGHEAELVAPGIDLNTFRPLTGGRRRDDIVLAIGRKNPLKRFELTARAWRALPDPRPELCLFGVEPEVAPPGARYIERPSDAQVNELLNECTVFVQTSAHEGFALPPLEAMAAGAAVVCTDAHGNRDFCEDGVNCLMPSADPASVRDALARVLGDRALRERLAAAGVQTARAYAWDRRVRELEAFLARVADKQRQDLDSGAVPQAR
jgi:glycosyltransferase involved in cell wall biosynthesis